MASSTSPVSEVDGSATDGWPWPCLDCDRTIFHDSDYCQACESAHSSAATDGRTPGYREFTDWMRREPYPSFLLKIGAIAGTEVALTALWLHVSLVGLTEPLQNVVLFV